MISGIARTSWVTTIFLGGLALGYLFLFLVPSQRAMERLSEELATEQDFIAQVDALIPAIEVTQRQLSRTLKYNARWVDIAPSEGELAGVYGKIHALAKAAGVATTRFDPQPAVQYEKVRMISVAVGYNGTFQQMCRYLHDLEALPQTIWIDNLQLQLDSKLGKDVHCELTLAVFVDKTDESDQVKGSG
jgi:Tfp pilus assembly protein PilO